MQVSTLPASACLDLLSALETGVSNWSNIQAAADRLEANGYKKLCRLVATGNCVAQAGRLLDRLGQEQRARLRTAALCMARAVAAVEGARGLPTDLSRRILVMSLADS